MVDVSIRFSFFSLLSNKQMNAFPKYEVLQIKHITKVIS
jgi:hypothetical protein